MLDQQIRIAIFRVLNPSFYQKEMRGFLCHWNSLIIGLFLYGLIAVHSSFAAEPVQLHPDNPHYFLFRGKPIILVSAAEHYGAVVNLDFDYIPYLDELRARGFNLTQIFSGIELEDEKSTLLGFSNPLAVRPGRLLTPWARSVTPGYFHGGNKFDLKKFDAQYFSRLRTFVSEAGKRGIIVEINLFWLYYTDHIWDLSPLNARNNINEIGKGDRNSPYHLSDPAVTAVQTAMIRKFISELKDYDNIYYEVADGGTLGSVSEAWSDQMIATIVDAEGSSSSSHHLIAQNLSGNKIRSTNPNVSIFDFPAPRPETVAQNAHLPKIVAFSDVVGLGTGDKAYRLQGWDLILSGAGVYLCRDYTFTPDYEEGAPSQPPGGYGGGSLTLRKQLTILTDFINSFDFVKMTPSPSVVRGLPDGAIARVLAESGKAYAIYIGPKQIQNSNYSVRWTGFVEPRYSETYKFYTRSDDGARLRINGRLLIDDWNPHPVKENSATIALEAGKRYAIEMEYFQSIAGAEAALLWSSPSQPKEIIPQSQLSGPDGSVKGLKGEYYRDVSLSQLEMTRYDNEVSFNWSRGASPFEIANNAPSTRRNFTVDIPAGNYRTEWLETATGKKFGAEEFAHAGGLRKMILPDYSEGVALSIKRISSQIRPSS